MNNIVIKELVHEEKYIPLSIDNISVIESDSINFGYETFSASPKVFNNENILDIGLSRTIEINLSVEKLVPNSNFMNIWIGNQLMMGTMVNENSQIIKGYISKSPSELDKVFLEYPNGERKEFKVPIISSLRK